MTRRFVLDPNLQQFATDRQWELLSKWDELGNSVKAAKELGLVKSAPRKALSAVRKKAAARGYAPQNPIFHNLYGLPSGFVLRGQSALVNADGELRERWDKTRMEGLDPDEARKLPDPKKTTKLSTMTDAEGRVIVQWVAEKPEDVARERAWEEFAAKLAQGMPRLDPLPAPKKTVKGLLAGYPVGDHHFGMYSWDRETGANYDTEIGERLLTGAVDYLANAVGPAEDALIAFLGDFVHYDSHETVTPTNRNQLDSDTRFANVIDVAVRSMRSVIDTALRRHRQVKVIVEFGNHDPATTVLLIKCLEIAYEKEPRVSIDISPMHYHYHRHGSVLIGTHHGHEAPMKNLPLIMASDKPEDWGSTKYRYWWTGHVHHSKTQAAVSAQDFTGCQVESFRILPPQDAWASQKGFRSVRDMKAIVLHEEYGEVARHTVNPRMLGEE